MMNHLGTKTIETERLTLRAFELSDAEAAYKNWTSDARVTEYLRWPTHKDLSVTEQIIKEWVERREEKDFYQWAIVLKEIDEPIGSISVVEIDEHTDTAHIGYCIGSKWWNQGITSEAFGAMIPFLFNEVGVNRIEAQHDPDNPHSGDVMRKCGLKYEGTLRQADYSNRGIVDASIYGLLRSEFLKQKAEESVTHIQHEDGAPEPALVIENLCKAYPDFRLDNVSFAVKKGRIMGFIGRNGAGKTTTLKCALNLVKADSGSINYFGMELIEHEKEIKQNIGFASGGVDYYLKKKIKDIVSVTKLFYENWDDEMYRHYIKMFSIDENKTPEELSAGMKVKLNLALALSHQANLLLLDEPTSGLDPVSRDEIMTIFEYLRDRGCAILFSTHVTSDLDKCADDITYIHGGKIVASMPKERFISENKSLGKNVEEIMISLEKNTMDGMDNERAAY